jgi:hypothetical protein
MSGQSKTSQHKTKGSKVDRNLTVPPSTDMPAPKAPVQKSAAPVTIKTGTTKWNIPTPQQQAPQPSAYTDVVPEEEEWNTFLEALAGHKDLFNILFTQVQNFEGRIMTLDEYEKDNVSLKVQECLEDLKCIQESCSGDRIPSIDIKRLMTLTCNAEDYINTLIQTRESLVQAHASKFTAATLECVSKVEAMINQEADRRMRELQADSTSDSKKSMGPKKESWADIVPEHTPKRLTLQSGHLVEAIKARKNVSINVQEMREEVKAEKYDEYMKIAKQNVVLEFPRLKYLPKTYEEIVGSISRNSSTINIEPTKIPTKIPYKDMEWIDIGYRSDENSIVDPNFPDFRKEILKVEGFVFKNQRELEMYTKEYLIIGRIYRLEDKPGMVGIVRPSKMYNRERPYRFFMMPARFGAMNGFRGTFCLNSCNPSKPTIKCTSSNCTRFHPERHGDYFSFAPGVSASLMVGAPFTKQSGVELPHNKSYPVPRGKDLPTAVYPLHNIGLTDDHSSYVSELTNDAIALWMAIYDAIRITYDTNFANEAVNITTFIGRYDQLDQETSQEYDDEESTFDDVE